MCFSAAESSSLHTCCSRSEVNFFSDDQEGLFVTIDTERLHIRSVRPTEAECDNYVALFGDRGVMEKFATGQTKTKEQIQSRIHDVWVRRWQEGDPYTGLSVFKNDSDDFLGHVVLGHGDQAGCSELAYLFNRVNWGRGYGTEAVTAVVKQYAPATVQKGYLLDGKPLEKITATTRFDNPASRRILEKVDMDFVGAEEKYGVLRHHYSVELSALES